ncbi:hypothetical protein [Sorangium sp. So ce1097]|uniref:hypothetical protein n=1 Tax=Sorangium sp. So ce1097 TaxID=3133330 RepID=UPI003F6302ED
MMPKGVTKVSPVEAGHEDGLNRQRVKRELLDTMRALADDEQTPASALAPLGSMA